MERAEVVCRDGRLANAGRTLGRPANRLVGDQGS